MKTFEPSSSKLCTAIQKQTHLKLTGSYSAQQISWFSTSLQLLRIVALQKGAAKEQWQKDDFGALPGDTCQ